MAKQPDPVQRIRDLVDLRDSGAISDDEFEALKSNLVAHLPIDESSAMAGRSDQGSRPSNSRWVIGVALMLGGILIAGLLYVIVPVGGKAWTNPGNVQQALESRRGTCDLPPLETIPDGDIADVLNNSYTCYDSAIQRRNIALSIAFVGVAGGILFGLTGRKD